MGKGTRAAGSRGRGNASGPPPSTPGASGGRQGYPPQQSAEPTGGGGRRAAGPPPSAPAGRAAGRQESGRPKSGRGATFTVLMMTAAALAGVGVLAAQAAATAPRIRSQGVNAAAEKTSTAKTGTSSASSANALPANSGSGTRIVYSPGSHRVWLVEKHTVERTMAVVPGTIAATAGSYTVSEKEPGSTGGDNVQVLYVVRFASGSSTVYGFDAEANVTGLPPAPTGRTSGIRMAQLDAQALYEFASVGTVVVVVN